MIGKTISHYKITGKLGAGGMGVVYRAHDENLDRNVALKVLPEEVAQNPERLARFEREAKAVAALNHPNIVTIYSVEKDDGVHFFTMELVEGQALSKLLTPSGLPLDRIFDLAIPLADAVNSAHSKGVAHRDLKPANIIIDHEGRLKVLDFGLAKLFDPTFGPGIPPDGATIDLASSPTIEGKILGTPDYMSPEQAEGKSVDHRSDIFSLGIILYEMISGNRPFQGNSPAGTISSILRDTPVSVEDLRSELPHHLGRIIGRCLAKPPDRRYQSALDLRNDLEELKQETELARLNKSNEKIVGFREPGQRLNNLRIAGFSAAVAILVLGALVLGLNVGNLRVHLLGKEKELPIRSLAILPFDNMMGDAEQDFFVEGMHESLITELSKIGTLRVISRTSAMYYRESDKSIPEIARELNVDAVVEGSVLRVEDRVRVTAQLIRGSNDEHLWAEDYDRDLRDILNLLSEVARSIAGEIQVTLTPRQQERLTTERTVDPDVYELYLRGLHHLHKFTENDARESLRLFQEAIDADPSFALAHVGLGGVYIAYSIVGDRPARDLFPPAREAAQRALELDPSLGVVHIILGFVEMYYNWDWAAAEREFERALEQNPNDGDALHGLASVWVIHGRIDEAVELVVRARKFDPYSYLRNLAAWIHLYVARRYQEVFAAVEQWRTFSGDTRAGWSYLFRGYYHLGRYEEAMAELRHSSTGLDPESAPAMETAYTESGIQGAFLVCAERLAALAKHEYIDPITIASYFGLAGDADQTFVWLEKGYEERAPVLHLLAQPALDPYRSDPRFRDLMVRFGIPESGWEGLGRGED